MPSPRYMIKLMSLADFDNVVALWKTCEGVGLNESDTRAGIASYLKRNPRMSFVVYRGTELVGAVLCGHDGRRGYLHHLAVAKAHRRKGLGQKLVAACLAKLKALRILKCNIFLYADNKPGERFWVRNDWKKRGDLCVVQKNILPSRSPRCC